MWCGVKHLAGIPARYQQGCQQILLITSHAHMLPARGMTCGATSVALFAVSSLVKWCGPSGAKALSNILNSLTCLGFPSIVWLFMQDAYLFISLTDFYSPPIYGPPCRFDNGTAKI
jgi:hypothetical protein